jgi:hypothetical protein
MSMTRALTFVIVLLSCLPAAAQERRQGGPPPYDLAGEKTVSGTIVGTDTITPPERAPMMFLTVTVDGSRLQIILAPDAWMKKQNFVFKAGEQVEVTGVPGFRLNSEPAMMGRKLTSGGRTLEVRDQEGKPRWDATAPGFSGASARLEE